MKKILTLMGCALLTSCGPKFRMVEGPSPGTRYTHQMTAPFPWVRIVPSERAIAFKEVDFASLNDQLRFNMSVDAQKSGVFQHVCLVLMDYTILPEEKIRKDGKDIIYKGEIYSTEPLPKMYFMKLSFYNYGNRPPAAPDFEEQIMMPITMAHPQEAMYQMSHEIYQDHQVTPLKKIEVLLN